jgi:hypothetical protein
MSYIAVIENGKVTNLIVADLPQPEVLPETVSWIEYFQPSIGDSYENSKFFSEG